ncbi:MAG: DUF1592 domain-containing protein [Akkermansiaceae bacterium]
MRRAIPLLLAALTSLATGDVRKDLEPFLETHCYDCHDDFDAEADLNLMDLKFDPTDKKNRAIWEKVFHRVEEGDMPPKKKKRPEKEALAGFLKTLGSPIHQADRQDLATNGRVHSRRLTTEEYEYSVHDLLSVDIPLQNLLTAESKGGFETTAESQQISHFHLDNYLRAADRALDEAFTRALKGESDYSKSYTPKDVTKRRGGNYRGPEFRNGKAIAWSLGVQFYGRIRQTVVPSNGWYRVTIKDVHAINPGDDNVLWGTLQTGSGDSNEPLLFTGGIIEATKQPRTLSFDTWMLDDHLILITVDDGKKHRGPASGGDIRFSPKVDLEKQGVPGIAFSGITIERIYPNGKRWAVRNKLFPGLDPKLIATGGPTPGAELKKLVSIFANKAFRRPVSNEEVAPYQELALQNLKAGKSFPLALRSAYHAILCSPNFLTFVEKPGPLDDHAIASRLSYLLWRTLPDSHLRKLADEGKLRDSKVFHNQIDRLLADPKSERFLKSFTDQWLDLALINFTQPDPRRFRNFDIPLEQSMLAETRTFINELITKNLPVSHLVRSDFTFLNARLQSHYWLKDLPVKPGGGLQKIAIDPNRRSGVLMQGAIHKVTADGSVTSPILRGIWVNERILGVEIPPPPPGISAIEPDIRGAVSIRDQLAKHSNSTSCASCHNKIDPSGFALESFDPIGQYRTKYGKQKNAAKVDPSGVTPDGVEFGGINQWRDIYAKRPKLLAKAFASQILKFGTGGEIHFSDKQYLQKIVERSTAKNYGVKTLIHAALASDIFLNK